MIKLLIFDLDGTLIDSAPDIIATTNQLMREQGKPALPEATIVAAIGEGLKQLVFSLFPETHDKPEEIKRIEAEFYRCYEQNSLNATRVFPGVENFLRKTDRKIAIVTNKYARLTEKVLAGLGLDRYPWVRVFGADSLPNRKPDPLPLLEVMKAAEVHRSETVMIGDGIPDMIAARRAGVHSIAVEFGYVSTDVLRSQGASLTLSSFEDLPEILTHADTLPMREISLA